MALTLALIPALILVMASIIFARQFTDGGRSYLPNSVSDLAAKRGGEGGNRTTLQIAADPHLQPDYFLFKKLPQLSLIALILKGLLNASSVLSLCIHFFSLSYHYPKIFSWWIKGLRPLA